MTVFELAERIRSVRDDLRRIPTRVLRDQAVVEFASDKAAELDRIALDLLNSLDARTREVRGEGAPMRAPAAGEVVVDGRVITVETLFKKQVRAETAAL